MSTEENKALIRRFWQAVEGGGDLAIADEVVSPDFVFHNAADPNLGRGPEAVRRWANRYRQAFRDERITIEDQIAEGEMVVSRWSFSATHYGEIMGIPPTGRALTFTGIFIDRVVDGKLVEHWDEADLLGAAEQLGASLVPGAVAAEPGTGALPEPLPAGPDSRTS